ncbi:hypothetical protein M8998_14890 [Sphingobacterium sp. lm-10]|uniref:CBU_0592 family membrane protein n=1 Tax=Sphingobacterium sp. lm-10 TaxID=2944904 RepID=UPI00201FB5FB|nr:hypothetical protein [Sphingobacterium sp. lm-10]MCL7989234.1 hypothetical protein [Sphingobacterium sp. lm-10]
MNDITLELLITALGWLGFICCSTAFLLLNSNKITHDQPLYQTLNIIGGIGLTISAIYFNDIPNIAANVLWIIIAVFGFVRFVMLKRRMTK